MNVYSPSTSSFLVYLSLSEETILKRTWKSAAEEAPEVHHDARVSLSSLAFWEYGDWWGTWSLWHVFPHHCCQKTCFYLLSTLLECTQTSLFFVVFLNQICSKQHVFIHFLHFLNILKHLFFRVSLSHSSYHSCPLLNDVLVLFRIIPLSFCFLSHLFYFAHMFW